MYLYIKVIHFDLKPGNILFHNGEVCILSVTSSYIVSHHLTQCHIIHSLFHNGEVCIHCVTSSYIVSSTTMRSA